jgi:hypothetical protein
MSAFAQTTTGDLDISSGNLAINSSVSQTTAWKLTNLFGLYLGEWFQDTRIGLPIVQYVLVNNPQLPTIQAIFSKVILSAPGVQSILQMDLSFLAATRQLIASFVLQTNEGAQITGGLGDPFIISDVGAGQ